MTTLLLALACTDLADDHAWDDGDPVDTSVPADTSDTGGQPPGLVLTQSTSIGFHTIIDAKDAEDWVSIDLDADGTEVADDDPTWDLQVRRYVVALNGGVSGEGGVEGQFVPDVALDPTPAVPNDGWLTDQPDGDDENDTPDLVFDTWYDYDSSTHVLSPKPGVWFVRSTEGAVYGLQVLTYYNDAGDSGWLTLDWRQLSTPDAE